MMNENQYNEEDDEIKQVISHKKNEFRVEIRRKKMQQDFQSKRLKIINNNNNLNDLQKDNPFNNNYYNNNQNNNIQQSNENNQNYYQEMNEQNNQNRNNYNENNIMNNYNENKYSELQQPPELKDLDEKLNIIMMDLSEGYKMKDILLCEELITIIQKWLQYYTQNLDLKEIEPRMHIMLEQDLHIFCTVFTSMKYLQYENLQLNSFNILAQLTCLINRTQLKDMNDKLIFNHFIEAINHSNSPQLIDNLFHAMGNLAGDREFGSYFCSELVDRDIMTAVISLFELYKEEQYQIFIESYMFFIHFFIQKVPEIQRENVNQLLPMIFLLLQCFKKQSVQRYCLQCIQLIITYDFQQIYNFSDEDYLQIGQIIYENPQVTHDALKLICYIVKETDDDSIIKKLMECQVQSSNENCRYTAAFTLSNIATVPDQYIQNELLEDEIYKQIMKALCDDEYRVRLQLAFFLVNLISSATAETLMILIEKRSAINFLGMIFQKYNNDIEFILQALSSFWQLFKTISICANTKQQMKYIKLMQEQEIFNCIEQLIYNKNKEISEKAEGIFNQLQVDKFVQQNYSFVEEDNSNLNYNQIINNSNNNNDNNTGNNNNNIFSNMKNQPMILQQNSNYKNQMMQE